MPRLLLRLRHSSPQLYQKSVGTLGRDIRPQAECVNDFATPCVINLLCRVELFESTSFALAVG